MRKPIIIFFAVLAAIYLPNTLSACPCIEMGQGQEQYLNDNSTHSYETKIPPMLPQVQPGSGPRGVADTSDILAFPQLYTVNGKVIHIIPTEKYLYISLGDNYFGLCLPEGMLLVKSLKPFTVKGKKEGIFQKADPPEVVLDKAVLKAAEKYQEKEILLITHVGGEPQTVAKGVVIPGTLAGSDGVIGGGTGKWTTFETNGLLLTVHPFEPLVMLNCPPLKPKVFPPPKKETSLAPQVKEHKVVIEVITPLPPKPEPKKEVVKKEVKPPSKKKPVCKKPTKREEPTLDQLEKTWQKHLRKSRDCKS